MLVSTPTMSARQRRRLQIGFMDVVAIAITTEIGKRIQSVVEVDNRRCLPGLRIMSALMNLSKHTSHEVTTIWTRTTAEKLPR